MLCLALVRSTGLRVLSIHPGEDQRKKNVDLNFDDGLRIAFFEAAKALESNAYMSVHSGTYTIWCRR